jgi:Flp pilus assembly CpaE family ATPase
MMLNVTSADDGVRPAKIEEVLNRQFFWLVPYDRQIRLGSQIGRPVVATHRETRGAQSIIQLAQALMGVAPAPVQKTSSPLRRLFNKGGNETQPAPAVRPEVIGNVETP